MGRIVQHREERGEFGTGELRSGTSGNRGLRERSPARIERGFGARSTGNGAGIYRSSKSKIGNPARIYRSSKSKTGAWNGFSGALNAQPELGTDLPELQTHNRSLERIYRSSPPTTPHLSRISRSSRGLSNPAPDTPGFPSRYPRRVPAVPVMPLTA